MTDKVIQSATRAAASSAGRQLGNQLLRDPRRTAPWRNTLALFSCSAAAAPTDTPAGFPHRTQIEVAAALELQPNGYLATCRPTACDDEQAEGDSTFDSRTVRLTTRRPLHRLEVFHRGFQK